MLKSEDPSTVIGNQGRKKRKKKIRDWRRILMALIEGAPDTLQIS